ncbi:MAG: hypothetical protein EBZ48_05610 [Proteobacteria bacterium]|nr:hypothetical protein [Pseudomonadota bacterium]
MNVWNRFAGILGLVAFGFGLVGAFVFRRFTDPYTVIHLVMGLLLLVYWFFAVGTKRAAEATQVVKGRTVRFGVSAILYSFLFVGVLIALNWIAHRYNKRIDLTEEGVYSLSAQSIQVIERLKKPLKIAVFDLQPENAGATQDPKDLLALYKDKNPSKVTTELINPRAKPQLIDSYQMKGDNVVYLEYGEGDSKAVSRINQVSEEALTNAIAKLTQGAAKKIYFLQGHGEPGLEDQGERGLKAFVDAVRDEHLEMESVVLSQKQMIPEDAAAIILAAPLTPLLPGEQDALKRYVELGGRLLLLTNPREGADVRALADYFGITVDSDVVIDLVQRLLMGPTLATEFMSNSFGFHEITKRLTKQDVMIFNMASSVRPKEKASSDATYTELIKTTENGWGETDLKSIFDSAEPTAQKDPQDIAGPVSLAVAYEKKVQPAAGEKAAEGESTKVSRVVVFGDSDWITNKYLQYSSHKDLILNSLNWLAGEESSITIRPKKMRASLQPIAGETFKRLLLSGFILPELVLISGLLIWWRRRAVAV